MCRRCDKAKARDRHHIDGNQYNNDNRNVLFLCRRCHMTVDGRLDLVAKLRQKQGEAEHED